MRFHDPIRNLWKYLLAVLLLTACSAQPAPAPTLTPSQTTPAAAETPSLSPAEWQKTILDSFRGQTKRHWRYESDTVTANGSTGHTTVEYVPPDRYHILNLPNSEMTIIGKQVYLKQDNQWSLAEVSASSIIDPQAASRLEKSISNVKCTSPEILDGKPMHFCQYNSSTKIGDSDQTLSTKLWIDTATNLPYKMIIDGAVGAMDSQTGKITPVKATTTLVYTYDPTLQINLPSVSK